MMMKKRAGTKNILMFILTKEEVASMMAMPSLILEQQHNRINK
jgi:hypothetical protein